ncbi:hypothetical protein BDV18DRAFT_159239 [Aspergillus unguis]
MDTEYKTGSQEESLHEQRKQDEAQSQSQASEDSKPRHERDLSKYGFRPVWTAWDGYPGETPDDIREWLDDDGGRESAQLIGPLRSLLWLGGYDELVAAIDDPAYVLEDEIRVVPQGTDIGWLVDRDFEEEKVPRRLYARLLGFEYDSPDPVAIMPARVSNVPGPVGDRLATHSIRDFYPLSRPQCLPESIQCVKFKRDRNQNRLLSNIRQSVGNLVDADNLWFRGTSFSTLVASLAFFIPLLHSQNLENEFGPGIYATNSFRYALDYAGNNGAVMVFQAPDLLRNVDLWEPSHDEWSQVVANWLHLRLENPLPDRYREADLMRGPVSRSRLDTARHNRLPDRSDIDQIVAVSYAGCAALAKSLSMIIYFES